MKKGTTLFLCLTLAFILKAQTPTIEWQKSLGGSGSEQSFSVIQTSDGGYAIVGSSDSTSGDVTGNHGDADCWIVKLNSTGIIQWQKSLGGNGGEGGYCIIQTKDGGYAIAGVSDSINGDVTTHHGLTDFWIIKLDTIGVIQWEKSLGGSDRDLAFSIIQTTDDGYAVAGISASNDGDVTGNHGESDFWVVKLNTVGTIQWQKSFGSFYYDVANSIIQTDDGGYVIAGTTEINSSYRCLVVKTDSLGALQYQQPFGEGEGNSVCKTSDGGYAVAGRSNSNTGGNHGGYDYYVAKFYDTGTIEWEKQLGGSDMDLAYSIVQTNDNGYAVVGMSYSNNGDVTGNHGGGDYWLVKLNSSGTIQWQKSLGGSNTEYAQSIVQTSDQGYAITGYSESNNGNVSGNHNFSVDCWVVKLGPTTGIEKTENNFAFNLYPNPAYSRLFFEAKNIDVTEISIYNTIGDLVIQVKRPQNKNIDVSQLPQGSYLVELKNENTSVKKRWMKM